jgi:hypothetical protein
MYKIFDIMEYDFKMTDNMTQVNSNEMSKQRTNNGM